MRLHKILKFLSFSIFLRIPGVGITQPASEIVICPDFNIMKQNFSSTANLFWFLGENHTQKDRTNTCLDILTNDFLSHTVYIEGVEAGEEINCEAKKIKSKPGRKCIGWDHMDSYYNLADTGLILNHLQNVAIASELKDSKGKTRYTEQQFLQQLHARKAHYEAELANADPEKKHIPHAVLKAINILLENKKLGITYQQVYVHYKNAFAEILGNTLMKKLKDNPTEFKEKNIRRNQNAINIYKNHSPNDMGVLIAGGCHFKTCDIAEVKETDNMGAISFQEALDKEQNKGYGILIKK